MRNYETENDKAKLDETIEYLENSEYKCLINEGNLSNSQKISKERDLILLFLDLTPSEAQDTACN